MRFKTKDIVEAALFAANESVSISALQGLFLEHERPSKSALADILESLQAEYGEKPIELIKTASGYRFQVRQELSSWVARLWEEKPVKYSRALVETLAVICYQQPTTRGEIEAIRGVSVSSQIIRSLEEREWVQVVGYKEVPGKPALYATTGHFLDYFNLQSLADLPILDEADEIDGSAHAILPLHFDKLIEKTN